jgi:hypothetical protein
MLDLSNSYNHNTATSHPGIQFFQENIQQRVAEQTFRLSSSRLVLQPGHEEQVGVGQWQSDASEQRWGLEED